ncbi:MAG: hypothetical protein WCP46_05315 [Alphaproteobacteria bacterium]
MFLPSLPIISSERLDGHMSPVQNLQLLRTLLYGKGAEDVIKNLTPVSETGVRVHIRLRRREWNCFHGNSSSKV